MPENECAEFLSMEHDFGHLSGLLLQAQRDIAQNAVLKLLLLCLKMMYRFQYLLKKLLLS